MARKVGRIRRRRLKAALNRAFRSPKPRDERLIRGRKRNLRNRLRVGYFGRKKRQIRRRGNIIRLRGKAAIRKEILSRRRRR